PEDQERIFEEFVQIEGELQAKVKGTGLGLPLSRRLAELLGGTLTLESEIGVGSTFSVRLPISFGQPEPTHVVRAPLPQSAGPTILFIEDNQDTSFVHESALRTSNYRLLFAANIPEARAAMRKSTPAVIALDRFIDGEDSLFYIKELKEQGYGGPVVVISVINEPQAALGAGADAFLAKPVAPFTLANTLRELIEGRTSHTVLLVDDDEVTRYVLGEALAKLGYSIVEARNGREAIRIMENHIPTGMFLDIVMPDLTGFEVLREMRHDPSTKDIPVVIHTSKELTAQEVEHLSGMGAVIFPKREFGGDRSTEKLREILATAGIG
ncbi:MAG: response regulator, partial [Alloacidobacterium sp.]